METEENVIILKEGIDFKNHTVFMKKNSLNMLTLFSSEQISDIPYNQFKKYTLLVYITDSLSDVYIGCFRFKNVFTKDIIGSDIEGSYKYELYYIDKHEFFNNSELNKIRSDRLNNFLKN